MDSDPNKSNSSANYGTPTWELTKLLLPTLATALIGLFIWNEQTKIQAAVDKNKQSMQMQLSLTEEYYKRRLTVYENACRQLADTKTALDHAGTKPEFETRAHKMMAEFDKLRAGNMLYWSPTLEKQLGKLWWSGITKLRKKKFDDTQTEVAIMSEIADLHAQMRLDLELSENGRILAGQSGRHE
jgi:hypothetical protein